MFVPKLFRTSKTLIETLAPHLKTLAKNIDKEQNKLFAIIMKIPRYPLEENKTFYSRRHREANKYAAFAGKLSTTWYRNVVSR